VFQVYSLNNVKPKWKGTKLCGATKKRPWLLHKVRDIIKQGCWPHRLRSCHRLSSLVSPNATHRRCKASWVRADPKWGIPSDNQATTRSEHEPSSILASLSSRTSHKRVARSTGLVSWSRTHDVRYPSRCNWDRTLNTAYFFLGGFVLFALLETGGIEVSRYRTCVRRRRLRVI